MRFSIEHRKFIEFETDETRMAVLANDKVLSWKQLHDRSLLYVELLKGIGIQTGQVVVIYGHKEADYVAAICACMMISCPYVPVDTIYPEKRIQSILQISDAFCLLNVQSAKVTKRSEYLGTSYSARDLIYIIFTSGSTGEPKGVQITKANVGSLLQWMKNDFGFNESSVFMNQALFSFDLSVYELFYFLNFGQQIILNSREWITKSSDYFHRLKELKTSVWVSTPSFAWSQSTSPTFNSEYLPDLKCFLFCGEVLTLRLVKKLRFLFPSARILNTYGPTEATVATTLVDVTDAIIEKYEVIPVGFPKPGTQVYPDDSGEICICGPNVMYGYLNRSDLNTEKMFLENNERGYRTGDLGMIKDGMIFCTGRADGQIKFHGYRIEISEIENVFLQDSGVLNVACLPIYRANEVIRIIAFVVLDTITNVKYSDFVARLKDYLPSYMIPSEMILIEELPLNANHKIDKKALQNLYMTENLKRWVSDGF